MGQLFSQIQIEGLRRYMAPKRNSETTFIIKLLKVSTRWSLFLRIQTFLLMIFFLKQRKRIFSKKNFINENVGIRRNQDHLVDTFKSFYNKSGLRSSFRGHITP